MISQTVIPIQHAEQFILGGNATLVVHNTRTHGHRKYKIWEKADELYYVYYNTCYLGTIKFRNFTPNRDTTVHELYSTEIEGFRTTWNWVTSLSLPEHVQLMHTRKCSVCKRPLSDPDSLLLGIGPECRKKLNLWPLSNRKS